MRPQPRMQMKGSIRV